MHADHQANASALTEAAGKLAEHEAQQQALQEDLQQKSDSKSALEQQVAALTADKARAEQDAATAHAGANELAQEVDRLNEHSKALQAELDEQEEKLHELTAQLADLQSAKAIAEDGVKAASESRDKLQAELAATADKLAQAHEEAEKRAQEHTATLNENAELKQRTAAAELQAAEAEEKWNELRQQLLSYALSPSEIAQLQASSERLQKRNKDQEAKLDELRAKVQALEGELARLRPLSGEIDHLNRQLANKGGDLRAKTARIQQLEAMLNNSAGSLDGVLSPSGKRPPPFLRAQSTSAVLTPRRGGRGGIPQSPTRRTVGTNSLPTTPRGAGTGRGAGSDKKGDGRSLSAAAQAMPLSLTNSLPGSKIPVLNMSGIPIAESPRAEPASALVSRALPKNASMLQQDEGEGGELVEEVLEDNAGGAASATASSPQTSSASNSNSNSGGGGGGGPQRLSFEHMLSPDGAAVDLGLGNGPRAPPKSESRMAMLSRAQTQSNLLAEEVVEEEEEDEGEGGAGARAGAAERKALLLNDSADGQALEVTEQFSPPAARDLNRTASLDSQGSRAGSAPPDTPSKNAAGGATSSAKKRPSILTLTGLLQQKEAEIKALTDALREANEANKQALPEQLKTVGLFSLPPA